MVQYKIVGGVRLSCATLVRVILLSAAFLGSLAAYPGLAEDSNQLPEKATKELSPQLLTLLQQRNMPKRSPILIRIFKEESELEVWKQDTTGHFRAAQDLSDLPMVRRSRPEDT